MLQIILSARDFIGKLSNRIRRRVGYPKEQPRIESLSPKIFKSENSWYASEILASVKSHDLNNVAITGTYGSGKSSILKQFTARATGLNKKNKVKTISFLNHTFDEESFVADNNINDKAKRPIKTEAIKTEILKQLFYQADPKTLPELPHYKLNNVTARSKVVLFIVSTILAVFLTTFIPSKAVTYNLAELFSIPGDQHATLTVIIFCCLLGTIVTFIYNVFTFVYRLLNKIEITAISANPKGIEFELNVDDKSFDELLDNLVYLFETCKYNIIIFEDLDRCNNTQIYYQLRQLNITLNNRLSFNVTFLYALKDDLITNLSDRTKLFDKIIPVVPFLSPDNSVDFMQKRLISSGFEYNIIHGVAKVIANHVTEARSLISICNTALSMKKTPYRINATTRR